MLTLVFVIIAIVLFILAAVNSASLAPVKVNLIAAGLAFLAASLLIPLLRTTG